MDIKILMSGVVHEMRLIWSLLRVQLIPKVLSLFLPNNSEK